MPIPVFVDVSNTGGVDSQETSQKASLPIIAITKPPAPLPVDLPTHDDITPASPDFDLHPDDIESTGSLMREVSHPSGTASEFSNPSHPRVSANAPKLTESPLSRDTTPPPIAPTTSPSRVTDLLSDTVPALGASPMKPLRSARSSPRSVPPPLLLPVESTPIGGDESDPEDGELTTTVRLVGSGVGVGLSHDQAQSDEAGDDDDGSQEDTSPSTSYQSYSSSEVSLPIVQNLHGKGTSVHDLREGQPVN